MDLQSENDASFWLGSYDSYLRDIVGAAAATRIRYTRVVRVFIQHCSASDSGWTGLTMQQIADFIHGEAASKERCGRRLPAVAVRSFLRFLAWRGLVPGGLDRAIPRTRLARHASIPRRLSSDEIDRLIKAVSSGKAQRRDRAMLLLLIRLGLRCSEVVELELDDIDWQAGLLRICIGKSHRERILPLPQDAGMALADYIQHDRPSGLGRAVFIGVNTPPSPLRDPSAITCMVKRTLTRAGIPKGRLSGAHMLRHTVASRLVNSGATLQEVADLLGHQCLQTTAIYAKLDFSTLARVAMPWVGGVR